VNNVVSLVNIGGLCCSGNWPRFLSDGRCSDIRRLAHVGILTSLGALTYYLCANEAYAGKPNRYLSNTQKPLHNTCFSLLCTERPRCVCLQVDGRQIPRSSRMMCGLLCINIFVGRNGPCACLHARDAFLGIFSW